MKEPTSVVIYTSGGTRPAPLILGNNPLGIAITPATRSYGRTGPIVSRYYWAKCLDDSGDSATSKTPVVTWDCNGSSEQNWTINHDETIRINGQCMGVRNRRKARVEILHCNGRATQQWQASNGTLVNLASNMCLDDPKFSASYGIQLEISACNHSRSQQWILP